MKKVVILASLLALLKVNAQPTWVPGVISGMNTGFTIMSEMALYYMAWKIVGTMESYDYLTETTYPIDNQAYKAKWKVFRTWNQTFQYSYILTINGVAQPENTTPYDIGPNGQPLCRREWSCTFYSDGRVSALSSATGSMSMKIENIVLRWPKYGTGMQYTFELNVLVNGILMPAPCSMNLGTPVSVASSTIELGYSSHVIWKDFPKNVDISAIYAKVKK